MIIVFLRQSKIGSFRKIFMKALDLYSRIEPLIGFYNEYEKLYTHYLEELSYFKVKTILDVGCGNGTMLMHLSKHYNAKGIDISQNMVEIASKKGIDASCRSIEEVEGKFDAILAVSDVLNYLDISSLQSFLKAVERLLANGGLFLCDINTLFGFEEVTAGSMSVDEDEQFLSIEADFNNNVLVTQIILFEKNGEFYTKESAEILQYYYLIDEIKSLTNLTLLDVKEISLFDEESDKNMLIFQKSL